MYDSMSSMSHSEYMADPYTNLIPNFLTFTKHTDNVFVPQQVKNHRETLSSIPMPNLKSKHACTLEPC